MWDKVIRYGFNSKEKDNEVFNGCIAFEARIYDSRIGRFFSTDPREMEYAWQSTYVYFKNCPISVIDFLGKGDVDQIDPSIDNTTKTETTNNTNNDGFDKDVTKWRTLRWKIKSLIQKSTPNNEIDIKVRNNVDGKKLNYKTSWRPIKYRIDTNNGGNNSTSQTIPSSVAPIGSSPIPKDLAIPPMIVPLVNLSENDLPGASRFFLTAKSVPITSNFTIPTTSGIGITGTLNISYFSDLAVLTTLTGKDNIPDQFVIINSTTGATILNTGQVLVPMVNITKPAITGDQFNVTITPNNIGFPGDRFHIIIWFSIP
jgi:RHS repeat-associated protein